MEPWWIPVYGLSSPPRKPAQLRQVTTPRLVQSSQSSKQQMELTARGCGSLDDAFATVGWFVDGALSSIPSVMSQDNLLSQVTDFQVVFNRPVLAFLDRKRTFIINTGARNMGVGSLLSQLGEQGEQHHALVWPPVLLLEISRVSS